MCLTIKHANELINLILQGRGNEFYAVVLDHALSGVYGDAAVNYAANYNIFLYLILGIVLVPFRLVCKIFGHAYLDLEILCYTNLVLAVALCISVYLVYDLCREMKMEKQRCVLVAYLYASSAMLLFATVGFSQLDLIYILFMLWALKKYLRQQYMRFSLLMGIAIMLKNFPLLVFIPLLLLVEKRILPLLKYIAAGLAGTVICSIWLGMDAAYTYTKQEMERLYGFTDRLTGSGFSAGVCFVSAFLLIVILLCIWCFLRKDCVKKEELWKYVIGVPLIVFGAFAVFVTWHPQWLASLVPFVAMAIGISKQAEGLLYCDLGMGIAYCLISNLNWQRNVDNYMVNYGILPLLTGHVYEGMPIADLWKDSLLLTRAIDTLFVACVIAICYLAVKGMEQQDVTEPYETKSISRGLVYARTAVIYVLVLAYLVMYMYVE